MVLVTVNFTGSLIILNHPEPLFLHDVLFDVDPYCTDKSAGLWV